MLSGVVHDLSEVSVEWKIGVVEWSEGEWEMSDGKGKWK